MGFGETPFGENFGDPATVIEPPAATVEVGADAPTIDSDRMATIAPASGTVEVGADAPTVSTGATITATAATIETIGPTPTVTTTRNQTFTASGTVEVGATTPAVRVGIANVAPTAAVEVGAAPPLVQGDMAIDARAAALHVVPVEAEMDAQYRGEWEDAPDPYQPPERTERPTTTETTRPSQPPVSIARPLLTDDADARRPTRELRIGGQQITSDRDITISASETGVAMLDCSVWNLDTSTWREIARGQRIEIELGWHGADQRRVFDGSVLTKRRRSALSGDAEFIIRGVGRGHEALAGRTSMTAGGMAPHRIVDHLADDLPLSRGYLSTASEPIGENYAITRGRAVRDWLDDLTRIAQRQTDRRWVWYVEQHDLYFHPITEHVTETITFDMDRTGVRATPSGISNDPGVPDPIELVTRCEPIARRGLTVQVANANAVDPGHHYAVGGYVFESGTTTGRHHTRHSLVPLVAEVPDEEVLRA